MFEGRRVKGIQKKLRQFSVGRLMGRCEGNTFQTLFFFLGPNQKIFVKWHMSKEIGETETLDVS